MSHDPSSPAGDPSATTGSTPSGERPGTSSTPTGPAASSGAPSGRTRGSADDPLRRSRAGGFYVATIGLGVVLVLLIIFIVQNTDPTTVHFLGLEADAPVAVLLLIAAAAGILLAGLAASLRILQLRRRIKHQRKA